MADHALVEWTIETLADNWNANNYPGSYDGGKPVLIDQDESTVYEITDAGTAEVGDATVGVTFQDRSVSYDLTENNAVTIGSQPDRLTTPVGTEFDFDVEDGVSIKVEGAHEDEFGKISSSEEFTTLWKEVRRALLVERQWPGRDPIGGTHYHTLTTESERNGSSSNKDYFLYQFDLMFRGYEDLP